MELGGEPVLTSWLTGVLFDSCRLEIPLFLLIFDDADETTLR